MVSAGNVRCRTGAPYIFPTRRSSSTSIMSVFVICVPEPAFKEYIIFPARGIPFRRFCFERKRHQPFRLVCAAKDYWLFPRAFAGLGLKAHDMSKETPYYIYRICEDKVMIKRTVSIISLAVIMAGAFSVFGRFMQTPPAAPSDLRDAPNSGAYSSLASEYGDSAPVPVPAESEAKSMEPAPVSGNGDWTGWLQGRSDFDYLPGTQNVDTGTQGFKVYYRCSKFGQVGSRFAMNMQFSNDKGGDLGIVTWTTGPKAGRIITVQFEGNASLFAQNGAPYTSKDPAAVLNSINNFNGMCAEAYKTVEAQRPVIAKFLLRKDIKSLQRMYKLVKFVPGPIGLFGESLEIGLDVGTGNKAFAGIGAGCLVAGIAVEKATHHVIKEEWIRYMLEKKCATYATLGTSAYEYGEERREKEEEPVVRLSGLYQANKSSTRRYVAQENGKWVAKSEPAGVALKLAYVEEEEAIKNVFFERHR